MRLRLGRVRYINCEPVYYALEHGLVPADCDITDGTPAELNARLRIGRAGRLRRLRHGGLPSGRRPTSSCPTWRSPAMAPWRVFSW